MLVKKMAFRIFILKMLLVPVRILMLIYTLIII